MQGIMDRYINRILLPLLMVFIPIYVRDVNGQGTLAICKYLNLSAVIAHTNQNMNSVFHLASGNNFTLTPSVFSYSEGEWITGMFINVFI